MAAANGVATMVGGGALAAMAGGALESLLKDCLRSRRRASASRNSADFPAVPGAGGV